MTKKKMSSSTLGGNCIAMLFLNTVISSQLKYVAKVGKI